MSERTLSEVRPEFDFHGSRFNLLVIGMLTGSVAGMGTFMFVNSRFMPFGLDGPWPLVIVGLGAMYTHLLAEDLAESAAVSIVAFAFGLAIHVGAWIAPLWILPFPPIARGLLLPKMAGEALLTGLLTYLMTFYGVYFGTVTVVGYFDP